VEPLYRIHVVAERVGVTEALLRAWERRYGLTRPQRTPGGYRAYTEADIEVLKRVKELTDQGVSIGEAARHGPALRREIAREAADAPAPAQSAADTAQLKKWREEILAAARDFDQARVDVVLDEALAVLPARWVFERLVAPSLIEVGDLWHKGELTVAQEHLVSQAARSRLVAALVSRPRRGAKHVVCACFPDEEHDVGLLGAALRFSEAGLRVTYLGARTPAQQLGHAVGVSKAHLVALSALVDTGPRTFRATLGRILKALPSGVPVVVGGAAARQHGKIVEALGARLLDTPEQWDAFSRSLPK
jgi:MerR family transcriptional regulator, light-induced transcriptional regulator